MTRYFLTFAILIVQAAPCLASPEEALTRLENAYRAGDIEAAVAAKDFQTEGRLMLLNLNPALADDAELIAQAAEVLELSFRKDIEESGFPDFDGVTCSVVSQEDLDEGLVIADEECVYPDGGRSLQKMLISNTNGDWRVVGLQE